MTFLQCIGRVLIAWGIVLCVVEHNSEFQLFLGMLFIIVGALLMDEWNSSPPQLLGDSENQSSTSS